MKKRAGRRCKRQSAAKALLTKCVSGSADAAWAKRPGRIAGPGVCTAMAAMPRVTGIGDLDAQILRTVGS